MEDRYNDQTINVRLPGELIEKADELVPVLNNNVQLRIAGRISRSTVLRLAVHSGIEELIKKYGSQKDEENYTCR